MKEYVNYILGIAAGRKVQCEVFAEDTAGVEIEVHRGSTESLERYRDRGVGIRLFKNGKPGYAFSSELSEQALESAFEEAVGSAEVSSPADTPVLADYFPLDVEPEPGEPDRIDTGEMIERVVSMEEEAFASSSEVVNTRNAGYSQSRTIITVGSTAGFVREESRGYCSSFISAIAKRGDEIRTGAFWHQAKKPEGVDFTFTGRSAAARAVGLLGARKIPGGRLPVLFDSYAFIDMLGFLEDILSADMVSKGMSCLAGRLGEKVAAEFVTVVDDPGLESGCGNSLFDDEGVPRRRIELISGGTLKDYFHTAATARKLGTGRPGNAVRSSFKTVPGPGGSNFYIKPSGTGRKDILAGIDRGVLIQNIMGIHTADTISGDFSLGFNGHYIRSGKRDHPLCEMTVAGTLLELLAGISAIADDLIFIGETGSPAVLVTGLSVSGE